MQLTGFHHLTAVTANVRENHVFYTQTLGLRLVKKTVNQDDVSAYHLFYADGRGSPGTDITFFDWPVPPEQQGTHSIVCTGFRVDSKATLTWWQQRFNELGVANDGIDEVDGRGTLNFQDPEGQRLRLVVGPSSASAQPWEHSPVPSEHQIRGLGPITISVPILEPTEKVLLEVINFRKVRSYEQKASRGDKTVQIHVYQMGEGGPAAELHIAVEPHLAPSCQGAGGVHHLAFRTPDESEYQDWIQRLEECRISSSGAVDRYYFRSLYFREPSGILFEIATDGPGFDADEPLDQLGENLALPPFLEPKRPAIEAGLKPLT